MTFVRGNAANIMCLISKSAKYAELMLVERASITPEETLRAFYENLVSSDVDDRLVSLGAFEVLRLRHVLRFAILSVNLKYGVCV